MGCQGRRKAPTPHLPPPRPLRVGPFVASRRPWWGAYRNGHFRYLSGIDRKGREGAVGMGLAPILVYTSLHVQRGNV